MSDPTPEQLVIQAIEKALAAPFEASEVKSKPAVVQGNRALALFYVDARVIQDRLDEVLGVTGWQDDYECLPDGSVICRLKIRFGSEWFTKVDVGSPSEQPDGGDRLKAAFSDSLKRCAVKYGIGRYLYRIPSQWVDYDPAKRQFLKPPQLPTFALPSKQGTATAKKTEPAAKKADPPTTLRANRTEHALPANGVELQKRLYEYDARLAKQGLCQQGELVKYVVSQGVKAGHQSDMTTWGIQEISLAVDETKIFELRQRSPTKEK
jgi:hypothetical protein